MKELHLKYRPKVWEDVIGHQQVVKSIRSALAKGSRTFLLAGDSGVGKTSLARLIASDVITSEHDLIEVDGATYTGIDAMRELTARLQYKSLSGGARVIVINECQGLSKNAWDSLLMSTEEPPPSVYWVLTTTQLDKVPKTVRTRFVSYSLKPVSHKEVLSLLKDIREKEGLKIGDRGLEMIVDASEGCVRQALVHLEACGHLKNSSSIAPLLEVAESSKEAIDLCRLLLSVSGGRKVAWSEITKLLRLLSSPPESTRIVIVRYMASVMMSGNQQKAGQAMVVLEQFSSPFVDREGNAPLVLACARVWGGEG